MRWMNGCVGRGVRAGVAGGVMASVSMVAWGQCPYEWVGTPGVKGTPFALSTLTTDEGTYLYMAGTIAAVGDVSVVGVARWDGVAWSAMGSGVTGEVRAVVTHEVGGKRVVVVGTSKALWWDGAAWQQLGSAQELFIKAMIVHDWDGAGPTSSELFAGGNNKVVRFNGSEWQYAGGQVKRGPYGGIVYALASFDEGLGPMLVAGGYFDKVGETALLSVARWDGQAWTPIGEGLVPPGATQGYVSALRVFDEDGAGPKTPALFAGGDFTASGSGKPVAAVAKWNGTEWEGVGDGFTFHSPMGIYPGVWEFTSFPSAMGRC